ncbi:MAG: peptide chain release factor N(5)-glutamine methyltransferase [Bacteroidota bacterium]
MNAPTTRQKWTVLTLTASAREHLTTRGFDEARLTVDLLLANVLRISRLELYLQYDRPVTATEIRIFKDLLKRRLRHEPLQYILGETEFMGLALKVDQNVLIPRPETELLAEKALETIEDLPPGPARVLDIGTGSGNIAIALAHFAPETHVTAIDVSENALTVAAENVARHGLKNVTLQKLDLFGEIPGDRQFSLVVSNPPYVPADEFEQLQPEIREFEPRRATTDDADGFRFINRISGMAGSYLVPGGALIVEIGYGQSATALDIMRGAGLLNVEIFQDYGSIPRVIRGWQPGGGAPTG